MGTKLVSADWTFVAARAPQQEQEDAIPERIRTNLLNAFAAFIAVVCTVSALVLFVMSIGAFLR
jgi:hypothetical protein